MRIGFDIGGTFTDVIAMTEAGELRPAKLPSFTDRIGESIGAFVDGLDVAENVERFVHATTTASNAVIERKAALTGLLTTRGFRDDLEMRGQRRPNIMDANWTRLPPLIARALRLEVDERILAGGEIDRPLDLAGAELAVRELLGRGVQAIAVCLINAYRNPAHERALGAIAAEAAPELGATFTFTLPAGPEVGRA
jgi:N-methylhydantoinase A/oxoprolinase/acetone carboxylase beta subunit